ncbi:hypothetical protein P153DRAFT_3082 [Dothidotthia symphoricarpi CBS 119687]|uniref:Uncharacterized protein n=1 Tax=Dothidotthia symphoricarpi CBS 119687 TaxID=1392245 RepID=A0A6A6ATI8_9PLEO|nr:uncharacterized protein P153DRAFT_3082 [Dothidotthia symphoricarpi CBS 119687]KAF2134498.1 hypothetical protein P153DRAFT_3082 [Dothidotthia symphoricarpi CBS 119687]
MNRTDSGHMESYQKQSSNEERPSINRSNTAPTRSRKTKKTPADSISTSRTQAADQKRPESEKRPGPSRRTSNTPSSENSLSRSKGQGHGSKPSSRRTSCTIVDPSRPARHYRIASSQAVATATSQDIDDPLALHFRSCSLFSNPSYRTYSGLPSPEISQTDNPTFPSAVPRFSSDSMTVIKENIAPKQTEEIIPVIASPDTTMNWLSPCTRQREYKRIDKANTGFRGLIRRVVPRCVSSPPERFYEKDQSDIGSVRRYRMDDPDDDVNEKDTVLLGSDNMERPATARSSAKKWTCF